MKKPRPKLFRAAHTREPVYVSCGAGAVIVGDIMFCDAKALRRLAAVVNQAADWLEKKTKK
jgi:hypothetical protein